MAAQMVKNPPAMHETWVCSLDWDNPLEKGMASHFSILAWTEGHIPWTEELGGLQSMGSHRVRHDWVAEHSTAHIHNSLHLLITNALSPPTHPLANHNCVLYVCELLLSHR